MSLDGIAVWARIKGLKLVGTADFTHPEWFAAIRRRLEPAGNGFLRLRTPPRPESEPLRGFPAGCDDVHFILSGELSFIFPKKGRLRRIHLLLLAPDLAAAGRINRRLAGRGKLASDGRPVLGMDAADFVRMAADLVPEAAVVPCHVWTPWYSLFGSASGFDAVEDCFEEMSSWIFALETGLSSDPAMNRRVSALDRYALVSCSDAHSPAKLGRESLAVEADFGYRGLLDAVRSRDPARFLYTVELFPEEGKYHFDGHRKCGIRLSPREARRRGGLCPVCGRKLTIGVLHRLEDLADRPKPPHAPSGVPFKRLVPLDEILGQVLGRPANSRRVEEAYFRLVRELGDEHHILTRVPAADLERQGPAGIGRVVERVRRGLVRVEPGSDGVYGTVRILPARGGRGAVRA